MNNSPTAIVIGAGSGIGRATAILLAKSAYRLLLVGRTGSKLQETAKLIRNDGNAQVVNEQVGDVTDPGFCKSVVDRAVADFGRIDAIANVAGHAPLGPIPNITPADWRQTIDANLSYVMYVTAAAWPTFKAQRSGIIVNVSSMASVSPYPGFALYAPAKAAVNMFTKITSDEGGKIGLRAVTVAPGAVETPMLRGIFSEKMLPKNKTLSPEHVAGVIVGCITGSRSFKPGETILVPSP